MMHVPPRGTKVLFNLTVVTLQHQSLPFPLWVAGRPASAPAVRCKASLNAKAFGCLEEFTMCAIHRKERCWEIWRGERVKKNIHGKQRKTQRAEEERKYDCGSKRRGWEWGQREQQNWKPAATIADVWLIEWHSDARGHTNANCSFVVAARSVVHQSPSMVSPDHRDTHHTIRLSSPEVTCRTTNSCHVHHQQTYCSSFFFSIRVASQRALVCL